MSAKPPQTPSIPKDGPTTTATPTTTRRVVKRVVVRQKNDLSLADASKTIAPKADIDPTIYPGQYIIDSTKMVEKSTLGSQLEEQNKSQHDEKSNKLAQIKTPVLDTSDNNSLYLFTNGFSFDNDNIGLKRHQFNKIPEAFMFKNGKRSNLSQTDAKSNTNTSDVNSNGCDISSSITSATFTPDHFIVLTSNSNQITTDHNNTDTTMTNVNINTTNYTPTTINLYPIQQFEPGRSELTTFTPLLQSTITPTQTYTTLLPPKTQIYAEQTYLPMLNISSSSSTTTTLSNTSNTNSTNNNSHHQVIPIMAITENDAALYILSNLRNNNGAENTLTKDDKNNDILSPSMNPLKIDLNPTPLRFYTHEQLQTAPATQQPTNTTATNDTTNSPEQTNVSPLSLLPPQPLNLAMVTSSIILNVCDRIGLKSDQNNKKNDAKFSCVDDVTLAYICILTASGCGRLWAHFIKEIDINNQDTTTPEQQPTTKKAFALVATIQVAQFESPVAQMSLLDQYKDSTIVFSDQTDPYQILLSTRERAFVLNIPSLATLTTFISTHTTPLTNTSMSLENSSNNDEKGDKNDKNDKNLKKLALQPPIITPLTESLFQLNPVGSQVRHDNMGVCALPPAFKPSTALVVEGSTQESTNIKTKNTSPPKTIPFLCSRPGRRLWIAESTVNDGNDEKSNENGHNSLSVTVKSTLKLTLPLFSTLPLSYFTTTTSPLHHTLISNDLIVANSNQDNTSQTDSPNTNTNTTVIQPGYTTLSPQLNNPQQQNTQPNPTNSPFTFSTSVPLHFHKVYSSNSLIVGITNGIGYSTVPNHNVTNNNNNNNNNNPIQPSTSSSTTNTHPTTVLTPPSSPQQQPNYDGTCSVLCVIDVNRVIVVEMLSFGLIFDIFVKNNTIFVLHTIEPYIPTVSTSNGDGNDNDERKNPQQEPQYTKTLSVLTYLPSSPFKQCVDLYTQSNNIIDGQKSTTNQLNIDTFEQHKNFINQMICIGITNTIVQQRYLHQNIILPYVVTSLVNITVEKIFENFNNNLVIRDKTDQTASFPVQIATSTSTQQSVNNNNDHNIGYVNGIVSYNGQNSLHNSENDSSCFNFGSSTSSKNIIFINISSILSLPYYPQSLPFHNQLQSINKSLLLAKNQIDSIKLQLTNIDINTLSIVLPPTILPTSPQPGQAIPNNEQNDEKIKTLLQEFIDALPTMIDCNQFHKDITSLQKSIEYHKVLLTGLPALPMIGNTSSSTTSSTPNTPKNTSLTDSTSFDSFGPSSSPSSPRNSSNGDVGTHKFTPHQLRFLNSLLTSTTFDKLYRLYFDLIDDIIQLVADIESKRVQITQKVNAVKIDAENAAKKQAQDTLDLEEKRRRKNEERLAKQEKLRLMHLQQEEELKRQKEAEMAEKRKREEEMKVAYEAKLKAEAEQKRIDEEKRRMDAEREEAERLKREELKKKQEEEARVKAEKEKAEREKKAEEERKKQEEEKKRKEEEAQKRAIFEAEQRALREAELKAKKEEAEQVKKIKEEERLKKLEQEKIEKAKKAEQEKIEKAKKAEQDKIEKEKKAEELRLAEEKKKELALLEAKKREEQRALAVAAGNVAVAASVKNSLDKNNEKGIGAESAQPAVLQYPSQQSSPSEPVIDHAAIEAYEQELLLQMTKKGGKKGKNTKNAKKMKVATIGDKEDIETLFLERAQQEENSKLYKNMVVTDGDNDGKGDKKSIKKGINGEDKGVKLLSGDKKTTKSNDTNTKLSSDGSNTLYPTEKTSLDSVLDTLNQNLIEQKETKAREEQNAKILAEIDAAMAATDGNNNELGDEDGIGYNDVVIEVKQATYDSFSIFVPDDCLPSLTSSITSTTSSNPTISKPNMSTWSDDENDENDEKNNQNDPENDENDEKKLNQNQNDDIIITCTPQQLCTIHLMSLESSSSQLYQSNKDGEYDEGDYIYPYIDQNGQNNGQNLLEQNQNDIILTNQQYRHSNSKNQYSNILFTTILNTLDESIQFYCESNNINHSKSISNSHQNDHVNDQDTQNSTKKSHSYIILDNVTLNLNNILASRTKHFESITKIKQIDQILQFIPQIFAIGYNNVNNTTEFDHKKVLLDQFTSLTCELESQDIISIDIIQLLQYICVIMNQNAIIDTDCNDGDVTPSENLCIEQNASTMISKYNFLTLYITYLMKLYNAFDFNIKDQLVGGRNNHKNNKNNKNASNLNQFPHYLTHSNVQITPFITNITKSISSMLKNALDLSITTVCDYIVRTNLNKFDDFFIKKSQKLQQLALTAKQYHQQYIQFTIVVSIYFIAKISHIIQPFMNVLHMFPHDLYSLFSSQYKNVILLTLSLTISLTNTIQPFSTIHTNNINSIIPGSVQCVGNNIDNSSIHNNNNNNSSYSSLLTKSIPQVNPCEYFTTFAACFGADIVAKPTKHVICKNQNVHLNPTQIEQKSLPLSTPNKEYRLFDEPNFVWDPQNILQDVDTFPLLRYDVLQRNDIYVNVLKNNYISIPSLSSSPPLSSSTTADAKKSTSQSSTLASTLQWDRLTMVLSQRIKQLYCNIIQTITILLSISIDTTILFSIMNTIWSIHTESSYNSTNITTSTNNNNNKADDEMIKMLKYINIIPDAKLTLTYILLSLYINSTLYVDIYHQLWVPLLSPSTSLINTVSTHPNGNNNTVINSHPQSQPPRPIGSSLLASSTTTTTTTTTTSITYLLLTESNHFLSMLNPLILPPHFVTLLLSPFMSLFQQSFCTNSKSLSLSQYLFSNQQYYYDYYHPSANTTSPHNNNTNKSDNSSQHNNYYRINMTQYTDISSVFGNSNINGINGLYNQIILPHLFYYNNVNTNSNDGVNSNDFDNYGNNNAQIPTLYLGSNNNADNNSTNASNNNGINMSQQQQTYNTIHFTGMLSDALYNHIRTNDTIINSNNATLNNNNANDNDNNNALHHTNNIYNIHFNRKAFNSLNALVDVFKPR